MIPLRMIAAGCAATLSLGVAQAGVISVQTSATEVAPGETFEVDVIFDAAMGEFLSTAEFDFEYDEELFRFVSAEPGDELVLEGDPDYIGSEDEPLVFEANQDGPGSLDVFASSYNSADFLAANQADSFSIVTFTFEALMMGTGQLSVAALDDFFADFFGEPIMVELGDASVTVEVVPLPGAAVFLLTGLAGLVARRRLG